VTNDKQLKRQLEVVMHPDATHDVDVQGSLSSLKIPPASLLRSRGVLLTSAVEQPCHSSHASCGYQNLLESWSDYFLLASSDFLLLERSGFSLTAASIGFVDPQERFFGKDCAYCLGAPPHHWCANETYNHKW